MTQIRHRYHSALLIGKSQTAARAGPLIRKHHALARRLPDRVSGCMRSMTGAGAFRAIRSYPSTAAKHGTGMPDALTRAASGTPWLPGTTTEPLPAAA